MSGIRSTLSVLAVSGMVALAPLQAAFAFEADEVGESLRALMQRQGVKADWSDIADDGSSITLEGVTLTPEGEGETVTLGDVALDDITEEADHYRVGAMSLPEYRQSVEGGYSTHMSDMAIDGLILPKDIGSDAFGGAPRYDKAEIGEVTVSKADAQLFTLDDFSVQMMQPGDQDGTLEVHGAADTFTLDLEAVSGDKADAPLKKLGYSQITGHLETAGSWRPSDGRIMLSQYDMKVDDAGTLSLTLDMSGYTPAFMKTMREMGEQMESASDDQKMAQGFAMLGMTQQLNLHGAMVRFTDDSLTDKALAYTAEKQGGKPEDVANALKALIPLQLTPYLGPDLTSEVTDAVSTFLDDPQNLEIRAEPDKPVSFAMIMGAAMSSPKALRDQLGLEIVANE